MEKSEISHPVASKKKSKLFYGYIVALAGFLVMMIMHAGIQSYGVFLKPVSDDFGWSRAAISGAYSASMFAAGVLNMISGRLADRFGARILVAVCGVLLGGGFLLVSRVNALWQLYLLYGVVIASGMSGGFVPMASTVAKWFATRRGLATGIVLAGVGAGTMIGAPLSGQLISTYGWRVSYVVMGIVTVASLVPVARLFRQSPAGTIQSTVQTVSKPEDVVLKAKGLSLQEATHTRQFWMLAAMVIFFGTAQSAIFLHIVPYATDIGISTIAAANILTAIGGINIIGRIGIGIIGDRVGSRRAIIASLGLMLVSVVWLLLTREPSTLYIIAVMNGLGLAGVATLVSILVAELFGTRAHGSILGMISFPWSAGTAIGPVIAGYIFDSTASYFVAFAMSAVFCLISLILALLLKPVRSEISGK